MPYYLITKLQYDTDHSSSLDHGPAWNLDKSKCIIHSPNNYVVPNYEQTWTDADGCNGWRYSDSEWSNWMTEEERNGD